MGYNYTLQFMRNGTCDYGFEWGTNNPLKALWWYLKLRLRMKYKIVTLSVRTGYTPCEKCDADWCDKSAV